jgi:integrase
MLVAQRLVPIRGSPLGRKTPVAPSCQNQLPTLRHPRIGPTLRTAGVPYFRLYDLRSTHATRLSAGGVADEWVTQMVRQTDAKVFKKYSQMKLQMKREALAKLNRKANEAESGPSFDTVPKP